ncbi:MAG: pyridoxamine 5'-phosphate oxidase family protein [Acidimicrobiia bacterium]
MRRLAENAVYDTEAINVIIDEALICHVGIVHEGHPVVLPTIHARVGSTLYFHGSPASRMLRSMRDGDEICVTITLIDGLVVARSAFHHSMNYRSVVVFGRPRIIEDGDEKLMALESITDHVLAGRWAEARPMSDIERRGTLVAALDLGEASAKVRTGGPEDDAEDYDLPIWAGVVPLRVAAGVPEPDCMLGPDIEIPRSVSRLSPE